MQGPSWALQTSGPLRHRLTIDAMNPGRQDNSRHATASPQDALHTIVVTGGTGWIGLTI
jgi:hypothetical protein